MRRGLALVLVMVIGLAAGPAQAQQLMVPGGVAGPPRTPEIIPDRYIVELHSGVAIDAVARGHGVVPAARFTIINGFAAHMPPAAANALSHDPRVRRVSPDLVVHGYAKPSAPPGKNKNGSGGGGGTTTCPTPTDSTSQVIPSGVARIGASPGSGATGDGIKVAVIDTGIDFCHPDLAGNYVEGINYIDGTQPPKDDNGHGTHVAGIIAAANNTIGVVGVAPGAKLLAAKALDASGSGSLSNVVSGIDWAVQRGAKVINVSLGAVDFWCSALGLCGAGAECSAISSAAAKGVVVVVAAGNSSDEALYYTPANCQDSLTVSALDDFGDTFAWFSNYSDFVWDMNGDGAFNLDDHPVVDIIAPGTNIVSTMPTYDVTLTVSYGITKNYGTLSGTSMATPHVAGVAARYISGHPNASAEDVRRALVTSGECPGSSTIVDNGATCGLSWPGDPDTVPEPLADASHF